MKLADKQIMLIDDDEVLRTLLTRTLNVAGCIVHSCNSIREALEQLKTNAPDLIILDLNMPEFDGFTFLKFRFMNKRLAAIPVIVLSGTKNKKAVQRALEMGADQFLEKPFESRIILQKLRYIFLSKTNFVFRFPENSLPLVKAEIEGSIIEQAIGRLKVESQVKFYPGKSIQLSSDDYLQKEGKTIVARIDNHLSELKDGFFRTILSTVGLSSDEKKHFELWRRSLSE